MSTKKFPIEASHILMFSRAIGDENPIYSDEEYAKSTEPGEIIAPPTFVQASAQFDPDYHLRPKIGQPWMGSGKNPTGIDRTSGASDGEGRTGGGLHAGDRAPECAALVSQCGKGCRNRAVFLRADFYIDRRG